MKRICSKCGTLIGYKEPMNDQSITHGFCDECLEEHRIETLVCDLLQQLEIAAVNEGARIKIQLLFKGKVISSSLIEQNNSVSGRKTDD